MDDGGSISKFLRLTRGPLTDNFPLYSILGVRHFT